VRARRALALAAAQPLISLKQLTETFFLDGVLKVVPAPGRGHRLGVALDEPQQVQLGLESLLARQRGVARGPLPQPFGVCRPGNLRQDSARLCTPLSSVVLG